MKEGKCLVTIKEEIEGWFYDYDGYPLFIGRIHYRNDDNDWAVAEPATGRFIANGSTIADAKAEADCVKGGPAYRGLKRDETLSHPEQTFMGGCPPANHENRYVVARGKAPKQARGNESEIASPSLRSGSQ